MGFKELFERFCEKHNYVGNVGYDEKINEYHIIISKEDDNAGAFMTKEELAEMSNEEIESLLDFLHEGFVIKFNK